MLYCLVKLIVNRGRIVISSYRNLYETLESFFFPLQALVYMFYKDPVFINYGFRMFDAVSKNLNFFSIVFDLDFDVGNESDVDDHERFEHVTKFEPL